MRRFFIWSALAALVGILLAGGAYWAYWHFVSRFQPVVISHNQAEVQQLLDEASWVSPGGGGAPLYIVGYRESAAMQRYQREEIDKLRAAGVEARLILFARPDKDGARQSTASERSTVAELWLTRDWSLYERWTATPARSWTAAGIPMADGNLALSAVVDAGRQFDERLTGLLKSAGVNITYPLVLWRDRQGFLKACGCADPRSWAFVRDDLGAPERVRRSEPSSAPAPGADAASSDGAPADGSLPYPALPPYSPTQTDEDGNLTVPGAQEAASSSVTSEGPSEARPTAPRPQRPAVPRAAPVAQKQDDATFF